VGWWILGMERGVHDGESQRGVYDNLLSEI
jgi:hypothetical protein